MKGVIVNLTLPVLKGKMVDWAVCTLTSLSVGVLVGLEQSSSHITHIIYLALNRNMILVLTLTLN